MAAMEGDVALLKQMKIIKKGRKDANTELPDAVGGAVGESNIAEMFKESYESLYNSAPSAAEMNNLKAVLEDLISLASKEEVNKVTQAAKDRCECELCFGCF